MLKSQRRSQKLLLASTDSDLTISAGGTIRSSNGIVGRVGVVMPDNPQAMRAEGALLYAAAGPTTPVATPKLVQGAIEGSNVQATMELTRMMNDLREFQFTSELVQAESERQQSAIDKLTQTRN